MDWLMGKTKRKDTREGEDERQYLADEFARQRIIDVDLDTVVDIPPNMDLNEWLATHTIKFFEHINFLYGAISDFCTCPGCANMTAPNSVQYQWVDDKGKKVKVTAAQYIEYVTSYTQKTICDENVFPTKYGNVFPATFEATVKKLYRLLFHVLAHIYHAHFPQILLFNLQGFINTVTAHFLIFSKRFALVDDRELEPLDDLYKKLMSVNVRIIGKDDSKTSLSSSQSGGSGSGSLGGDNTSKSSRTSVTQDGKLSSPLRAGSLSPPPISENLPTPSTVNTIVGGGESSSLSTSQSSLTGVHMRQNLGGVEPGRNSPTRKNKGSTGSNGSVHNYLSAADMASGKTSLSQLVHAMEENKENLLQLSSSPVLTTQPNGHPRTPST